MDEQDDDVSLEALWNRYVDESNWRKDGDKLTFAWGGYRVAIAWRPGVDLPDDADWAACVFEPSGWAWSVHAVDGKLVDGSNIGRPTVVEAKVEALDLLVGHLRYEADSATIGGPILRVVP